MTHDPTGPTPQTQGPLVVCGQVPVTHTSPTDAVSHMLGEIGARRRGEAQSGVAIHFVNAWTVVLAETDPLLTQVLAQDVNFPDGTPVVWHARMRGRHVPADRVRGPSYFLDVLDQGRAIDARHFLLGGTDEMLNVLRATIADRFPGVIIAGVESPPFRPPTDDELREQDARIAATRPDVVWVGLGSPKQEFEAHRLASTLNAVVPAVGAAFDFTAGRVTPAPEWMQRSGLEWLHRLGSEPRRLWRRYLVGNAKFVWIASRGPR